MNLDRPAARRIVILVALGAVVLGATGCAAWKIGDSARMAKATEPFQAQPPAAARSLLVIGDSTAVGTGASAPSMSVPGRLASRDANLRVVNKAENGAKYEDFAAQIAAAPGRYDTVLVLGGGNDVIRYTSEDKLRSDVRRVIEAARQKGSRVIVMPPGNVGNAPFFFRPLAWSMDRRSRMLHDIVRTEAASAGVSYVGLYQDRERDPFALRPQEMHARDGLHPSDAGYALWTQELVRQARLG